MQLSQETLSKIDYSKNRFLIDWFSFSSRIDSFESFRKLLGLDHVNWEFRSYSANGYTNTYYFEGVMYIYFLLLNGDFACPHKFTPRERPFFNLRVLRFAPALAILISFCFWFLLCRTFHRILISNGTKRHR